MKFYPSADDFTQALLVMLVTNFTSGVSPSKLNWTESSVTELGIPQCLTQMWAHREELQILNSRSLDINEIFYYPPSSIGRIIQQFKIIFS